MRVLIAPTAQSERERLSGEGLALDLHVLVFQLRATEETGKWSRHSRESRYQPKTLMNMYAYIYVARTGEVYKIPLTAGYD